MSAGGGIILEARDVVKRYPGHVALDHITYRVHRNAVNVLIGENGAGKSTLMRILAGVEQADEGTLWLEGQPLQLGSPREASAQGIAIVHQELAVLPNLNVAENVFAGRELTHRLPVLKTDEQKSRSASALRRLHKPLAVEGLVAELSLGNRQLVELARTLAHGARVLILDEPTSALSVAETAALFQVVEELRAAGVTILYISHRLHELLHLGDYFTVLRSGRIVGEAERSEVTRQWIVERMSGRSEAERVASAGVAVASPVALEVKGLRTTAMAQDESVRTALDGVSLVLRRGEVLGLYGLLGAGRTELLEVLAGLRPRADGEVLLDGQPVRLRTVAEAIAAGIAMVPEDRQRDGLVPELSIRENVVLAAKGARVLSPAQETQRVRELATQLNIVAHDLELPVTALSGGNQQKVLLARCLACAPRVLLLDEPTRGIDVGAKHEIYRILRQLASAGLSILFTSSEVEETTLLADRALVLCQGRIAAELPAGAITDEALFAAASPQVATTAATSQQGSKL
ncbi:MAG: sugar ABC transporter ATP-binding protein [Acidobacteriota bacterium]|nr:sugar ABC transporter ATP-binding protein [Acidobacteriota bacterium]